MAKEENVYVADNLFNKECDRILGALDDLSIGGYTKSYETWKRAGNIIRCFKEEVSRGQGPLRILDLGCADGLYVFLLNSIPGLKNKLSFYGVDISAEDVCIAEKVRKILGAENIKFIAADLEKIALPEGYFNIVLCAEVIEHIADSDRFLSELHRILAPGGAVIITTPNKSNLFLRLKKLFNFLFRRKETDFQARAAYRTLDNKHISVRGLNEWGTIIHRNGLVTERIKRGGLFRGGPEFDSHPLLFGISVIIDRILDYLPFALNVTENVTFKLRKPVA
jgi:ubiquinone/menaquinone biosynthesis C-methylase UbiE